VLSAGGGPRPFAPERFSRTPATDNAGKRAAD
jgi:hypothetical protein